MLDSTSAFIDEPKRSSKFPPQVTPRPCSTTATVAVPSSCNAPPTIQSFGSRLDGAVTLIVPSVTEVSSGCEFSSYSRTSVSRTAESVCLSLIVCSTMVHKLPSAISFVELNATLSTPSFFTL